MDEGLLRTIARLDGTPFPSTARMAAGWLRGRIPTRGRDAAQATLESAYCAEVVAITYDAMGLLGKKRRPSWFDPGRFWSGDGLKLASGRLLGGEIAVDVPTAVDVPQD
jgi:hypothetical protein